MATILVPTDFSKNASNALSYAISLSKKEKSKIILLHAFDISYINPDVPVEYFAEQLEVTGQKAEKILNKLCDRIMRSGTIKCEVINKKGLAVDIILNTIKRKKPDLVVMGTKGASGLKKVFMGSNTAKVIGKSSCPVIAVPEKSRFKGISKIVYATDFYSSDINALKQLADIAKVFGSAITMVHIVGGESSRLNELEYWEKFTEKVKRKVQYKKISFHLLYAQDMEKKLEEYIKKESVNLLAMSTRYRNLFERLLEKSITKKLVYHTKIPLMVFHHKQKPMVFI